MPEARHHHAVRVVLVPSPVGGSPEPLKRGKPPAYPVTQRQPWRPAQRPPTKAAATLALMHRIVEQEAALGQLLRPCPPRAG
jgi:hypothetical protein